MKALWPLGEVVRPPFMPIRVTAEPRKQCDHKTFSIASMLSTEAYDALVRRQAERPLRRAEA